MMDLTPILPAIITSAIAFLSALIGSRNFRNSDKRNTRRKMIENCYLPLYNLLEYKLYQDLTLEKTQEIGKEIVSIFTSSNQYFYPSLKIYAERLVSSNQNNYFENWLYFCNRFDKEYDRSCKLIGLPIRSRAYRINRKQFHGNKQFYRIYFLNLEGIIEIFILFIFVTILFFMIYNSIL